MKKSSQKSEAILSGLMEYLEDNKEENILAEVTRSLEEMVAKSNKSDEILVTSPTSLSKSQLKEIGSHLKKNLHIDLPLVSEIDKNLIAGFTIKVNDWFFDGSLSNQLNNIKRSLKSS